MEKLEKPKSMPRVRSYYTESSTSATTNRGKQSVRFSESLPQHDCGEQYDTEATIETTPYRNPIFSSTGQSFSSLECVCAIMNWSYS